MTTPSKPDLVALADWLNGLAKPDSNVGVHLEAKERATIVSALRHLASQPSLYEAGLRDGDYFVDGDRYHVIFRPGGGSFSGADEIVCSCATGEGALKRATMICDLLIAAQSKAAIAALPADGGEVDDERCIACDRPFQDGDLVHSDAGG